MKREGETDTNGEKVSRQRKIQEHQRETDEKRGRDR